MDTIMGCADLTRQYRALARLWPVRPRDIRHAHTRQYQAAADDKRNEQREAPMFQMVPDHGTIVPLTPC